MKKNYFLLALLVALFSVSSSYADTYKVDFEQAADTTDPEFRVDAGWGHIKDCFVHPIFSSMSQYVAYSYEAGAGVDGSQALKIGSQLLSGQEKNDLLVTPKVSGAVSIMVKSAAEGEDVPSIKFFKVENGAMGEEITLADAPVITADAFVKVVLPEQEGACIGIRGEYVYIDDFEAGSAEVTLAKGLTVVSATLAADAETWTTIDTSGWIPQTVTYLSADADGNYTLSYDIEVKNTGDVTLTANEEGYTVALIDQEKEVVLAENLPVTITLEPGQTGKFNVKAQLNVDNTGESWYLRIREDVTNTVAGNFDYRIRAKYNAPEPQAETALTITDAEATMSTFTDTQNNTCVVANEQGEFTLSFNVTVKNTGTNPIEAGTEGYSVQMFIPYGFGLTNLGEEVPVSVTLQPEDETVVPVSVTLNRNDFYQALSIKFRENITNTEYDTGMSILPADDPNVENRQMEIASVSNKTQTRNEFAGFSIKTYTDTDAEGNFTIEADVTVKNSGNVTLLAADEDMTVVLYNSANEDEVFATATVGQDLEPGQTATVNVKATLNIADYPNAITYYVKELVSGSTGYVVSTQAFKKETTVEFAIGEDGWATFSSDETVDFSNCEGLTAYIVTGVANGLAKIEEVTAVPAGYGVLLQGVPGNYVADIVDNAEDPEADMLVATGANATEVVESGFFTRAIYGSVYVLSTDEAGKPGFVKAELGAVIPAYQAYLSYTAPEEQPVSFIGINDGTTTAIANVLKQQTAGQMFNLRGQRVDASYKGIVVKNGKKQIIK